MMKRNHWLKSAGAVLGAALCLVIPVQNAQPAFAEELSAPESVTETVGEIELVIDLSSGEGEVVLLSNGLIKTVSASISVSSKILTLNAGITASETMTELGFKNIKVKRSSDQSAWYVFKTISDRVTTNASSYSISNYTVALTSGYYYYVTLDFYAKKNSTTTTVPGETDVCEVFQ